MRAYANIWARAKGRHFGGVYSSRPEYHMFALVQWHMQTYVIHKLGIIYYIYCCKGQGMLVFLLSMIDTDWRVNTNVPCACMYSSAFFN